MRTLNLAEINLPFPDERNHPRLKKYTKQHTLDWSASVKACDAFVVVTCEYNFDPPAPLKNALDYLSQEWATKPVALGQRRRGLERSAQRLAPQATVSGLVMPCITEAATVPMAGSRVGDGVFDPPTGCVESLEPLLASLLTRHKPWPNCEPEPIGSVIRRR